MAQLCLHVWFLTLTLTNFVISGVYSSATFTMLNKCDFTVWPGILSNAGTAQLSTTGFSLQKGESRIIDAPSSWGGRFWGRTHCTEDSTGKFSCLTADCGSGKIECSGNGAAPPATLAEFTLDGDAGMDFYDVSLVDGYNVPMLVVPQGGSGVNCTATGCAADLNGACPSDLRVTSSDGEYVACKSACLAFGKEQYCCNGAYSTPDACKPSSYSQVFKSACPRAYSYAYDDKTSTFTCAGADYIITFCPSPNTSQKSSSELQNGGSEDNNNSSLINNTIVYEGASHVSGAPSTNTHLFSSHAIAGYGSVAVVVTAWRLCQFF
ncbi:Pathogenesis-related thaumatin superfamily protein [Forsythia ovata]|uniref:Pathogenesis-related thaumatin superfamily protein n=1 Tax=Forsythia ovata TaxID=205694 RepID=A0ABD1VLH6_9LAMI